MIRIFTIFSFKRYPWVAIGALVAILVTEVVIHANRDRISTTAQILHREKLDFASEPANDPEILILGDSYVFWSAIPEVIERHTGFKTYNAALYGKDSTFMPFCILKNHLTNPARTPKAILIGFIHSTFSQKEIHRKKIYEFDRRCIDSFIREHGIARTALSFVPSVQYTQFFRTLISERTDVGLSALQVTQLRQELQQNKGYYALKNQKEWNRHQEPRALKQYPHFNPEEFSLRYFYGTLELAREAGIKVFYLIPTTPDGPIARYNRFLGGLSHQYPEVEILDYQDILYLDRYYLDGWHLNRPGAYILSEKIGQSISASLASSNTDEVRD